MFEAFFVHCLSRKSEKEEDRGGAARGEVRWRYGRRGEEASKLLDFCVPEGEAEAWKGTEEISDKKNKGHLLFTFLLTNADGSRTRGIGHRRRLRGSGSAPQKLETFVILSRHPFYTLFAQVLCEVVSANPVIGEEALLPKSSATYRFLSAIEGHEGTPKGHPFFVTCIDGRSDVILVKPLDTLGGGEDNTDVPLGPLLYRLPIFPFVSLVAALLRERRVVVTATRLDTLSNAITAAAALLHPFRWEHIILPLVPKALIDYLSAPMPFLIGVPKALMPLLRGMPMDEVFKVDLDSGICELPGNDNDAERLPRKPLETLVENLHKIRETLSPSMDKQPWDYRQQSTANGSIITAMRAFYVSIFAGYRSFVRTDFGDLDGANGESGALAAAGLWFDQEAFVSSQKSGRTRAFLDSFRHSQMFEVFINSRLQRIRAEINDASNEGERDAFDRSSGFDAYLPSSRAHHPHKRTLSTRLKSYLTARTTEVRQNSNDDPALDRWLFGNNTSTRTSPRKTVDGELSGQKGSNSPRADGPATTAVEEIVELKFDDYVDSSDGEEEEEVESSSSSSFSSSIHKSDSISSAFEALNTGGGAEMSNGNGTPRSSTQQDDETNEIQNNDSVVDPGTALAAVLGLGPIAVAGPPLESKEGAVEGENKNPSNEVGGPMNLLDL